MNKVNTPGHQFPNNKYVNTFALLLGITYAAHDGVKRNAVDAELELHARKLVVRDYIQDNRLPETITKEQSGAIMQAFVYFYL
jgi:hypothetical protein